MPQVAVVDDDPRIRALLQEELEDEGIDANLCASGLELFKLLESQPIDLILLDLMMPEMDGIECLYRLRQIDFRGRVLIVTALSDDQKRREALEAGADEYILKSDLFDRLPMLLERYSPSAPHKVPGSVGWKSKLFNSLYGQLQTAVMGAVFLGFALGTSATLWLNYRNLLLENKVEIERSSDAIKDVLARSLSARGQWHSDGGLGIQEELLRHTNWKQTFWIQLPDGMIMAPKASSSQIPFAVVLKAIQSSQDCQNSDHKVFSVEGRSYLTHSDRIIGPPGEQECSRLWVAEDITANVQVYRNYIRSMVMIWAVCLLVTLVVVSLLVRRIVYPLVRLNILAKSVNAANLDANRLVLTNAPLEVESLVDTYNQLLDRLSLSWRNQSEFVGAVSHELRNPLILISGYLRRTLRQAEGLSDTHRKGLLTAESEAKRIGRLLNDLLELAKSDSGRLSLILNPVDLEPLLIEVAELARESFLRAIDFVVLPGSGSTGKPINANADSDRLKQVVLNLIENSDKYSPRDSPITITLQQLAGAVLIRVCDQGVGVPKEDIPFIFQRFYRASNVSSDSGSGLGLSVVKLLVDAMGGEVSVENDVVQGTCFRIRLESDGGY